MPANFISYAAGSISKDPQFKDPATLDFHLKSSSPCIDASSTLAYANYDYDSIKRPQGLAYDMGAFEYTTSILPVSLLYFNARAIQRNALLTWITAVEQNNKFFIIQHSTDGIHFITLGNVNGHGNSNTQNSYEFTDGHPTPDIINYYRILQVDFDGQSNASNIVALSFEESFTLALYPNPAQNNLRVSIPAPGKKLDMKIIDMSGKVHWSNIFYKSSPLINIDISRLGKGAYQLVVIMENGNRKSTTFIKQ